MNATLILPQELGVFVQFDQTITAGRIALRLINGEQVAVRKQMAAKPMNLFVAEGVLDVGRARPRLAERQFPLMDHLAAHVEETGPCPFGRREKREAIVSLAWFVHGNPFLHVDFRRCKGIYHWLATFVPGLATRERLIQEIGRRKLEEHHGRPE